MADGEARLAGVAVRDRADRLRRPRPDARRRALLVRRRPCRLVRRLHAPDRLVARRLEHRAVRRRRRAVLVRSPGIAPGQARAAGMVCGLRHRRPARRADVLRSFGFRFGDQLRLFAAYRQLVASNDSYSTTICASSLHRVPLSVGELAAARGGDDRRGLGRRGAGPAPDPRFPVADLRLRAAADHDLDRLHHLERLVHEPAQGLRHPPRGDDGVGARVARVDRDRAQPAPRAVGERRTGADHQPAASCAGRSRDRRAPRGRGSRGRRSPRDGYPSTTTSITS